MIIPYLLVGCALGDEGGGGHERRHHGRVDVAVAESGHHLLDDLVGDFRIAARGRRGDQRRRRLRVNLPTDPNLAG